MSTAIINNYSCNSNFFVTIKTCLDTEDFFVLRDYITVSDITTYDLKPDIFPLFIVSKLGSPNVEHTTKILLQFR